MSLSDWDYLKAKYDGSSFRKTGSSSGSSSGPASPHAESYFMMKKRLPKKEPIYFGSGAGLTSNPFSLLPLEIVAKHHGPDKEGEDLVKTFSLLKLDSPKKIAVEKAKYDVPDKEGAFPKGEFLYTDLVKIKTLLKAWMKDADISGVTMVVFDENHHAHDAVEIAEIAKLTTMTRSLEVWFKEKHPKAKEEIIRLSKNRGNDNAEGPYLSSKSRFEYDEDEEQITMKNGVKFSYKVNQPIGEIGIFRT
jgi:hypothetical protein